MWLTKDILIGKAVGDALGVPVEFYKRGTLDVAPVLGMREYGSHHQPKGTWSDDTSMTICIIDAINQKHGYDLTQIANNFADWKNIGYFTANGYVFDIGMTTSNAITKIANGKPLISTGGREEYHKGNGALMRTLGLLPYLTTISDIEKRWEIISEVGGLTHATNTSNLACLFLIEYALEIIDFKVVDINTEFIGFQSFIVTQSKMIDFFEKHGYDDSEFQRLLYSDLESIPKKDIHSSGYVIHTLEAAIWSLMRNVDYEEVVLAAVNLGDDTDTVGAVAGGLAGLLFGYDNIPKDFINNLIRLDYLLDLSDKHDGVILKIDSDI